MSTKQVPVPRPYRNYLTPLLHRQFLWALLLSYGPCHVASLVLGCFATSFSILSVIPLPITITGLRTLLISVCGILVFIIRIWALQPGRTTTTSPSSSFARAIVTPNLALVSTALYLASAFFFGEISVFSASSKAQLDIVDHGGPADRPQLNERSLLFRSQFLILGIVQAIYHLSSNIDEVIFPLDKLSVTSWGTQLRASLSAQIPRLLVRAFAKTVLALITGLFAYDYVYRRALWTWAFSTLQYTYDFPRNSHPRRSGVPAVYELEFKFFVHAFVLTMLWDIINYVFSALIVAQPLKQGKPITSDSRDPNGTLLSGLRSRRQFQKSVAFWELVLISNKFDERRKTLYQELDRKGGSTWSQTFALSVAQLTAIQERIKTFKADGAKSSPPLQPQTLPGTKTDGIQVKPKKESVLTPQGRPRNISGKAIALANDFVKSQGSQQSAVVPVNKLLEAGAQKMMNKTKMNTEAIETRAGTVLDSLLKTAVAAPFRRTFSRRIQCVVCGSPSSRASIIIDAVSALATLASHSLKEDQPGQVQKNVGALARTIAATIVDIQDFIKTAPPHWTDVNFTARDRMAPEDVAEILVALKVGLEQILRSFGEYFGAIGVSSDEAKSWKKLTSNPNEPIPRPRTPDMQTVR